jgi:arabinose-5-phosphate isomerase
MHGDLGIVESDDCVVAFSNSGESEEVLAILPALLSRKVPIIAILGNLASTLAYRASVSLDASIEREICPLNLAPTTSVVVALAIGDALAMTLHKRRGFAAEDYARNHPGGRLGRRLLLAVRDALPVPLQPPPSVFPEAPLMEVLNEISAKCLGATCVVDAEGKMLGIITDYDTRQAFLKRGADALNLNASDIMNRTPKIVLAPEQRAYDALQLMEAGTRPISVAPVVDESGVCVAMLRLHDLVRAGL